jgi:ABC-type branched-subunit amino acid transport system ATPase component
MLTGTGRPKHEAQVGKSVLSGPAAQLAHDAEVQRIYLGVG